MEQKFYSTVEAADKAGITGAPDSVGKTFRRLAAKLGLVPTKEKGALCWTEADIAEVKANYKPRAKRTATVEDVTTAQVGEPTNAPVVEETATVETVDVPPANTGNTIDMTLYNTFMLWAEKISNGQHDAVYPFVAKLKETFDFAADKEEIIDAIKTDDLNGARRYLSQFNFVVTNEAGYLYKLVTNNNGEVVLVDLPAADSIPADVVVPPVEETDDREAVPENTPEADTLPAPMNAPPADVQPENADETEGILGKKIMPATAVQSTASKEIAEINIHGNDSTNGGVKQHLWCIPAEILALPRWLKTRDDNPKAPVVSKWQLPENQKPAAELNGIIGFVAATEAEGGLIFYDLDHCLTEMGTFINAKAEMWFNTITQGGKFYAEKSQSKHGVHSFAVPTEGKFPKSMGKLYLTEDKTAFIEVFYGTNKFCLPTGDTIRCPYHDAPIAKGEVADTIFQAVLDAITAQNAKAQPKQERAKEPARAQDYLPDNPEYDLWRAARMLDCIEPARLTDDNDWLAVISAAKNIGLPYAVVDSWNRRDPDRYNERENLSRWNSIKPSSGFDVETLHGIAQRFHYSESDTRREWHDLRGERPRRPAPMNDDARTDVDGNGRDALIDSLFDGGASDLAFAKRLEIFCGDRVKWCDEAKHWYLYSGGVWKKNSGENSAVSHFAADLAETMQQHAANDDEHKLAAAFQSAKKVGCSIGMLKACHSVRITLDDLDKHDELLNCLNGVVDLQTGKFYPADPKLLLTKQAGAAYVPNAQSSLVEDFFTAIQPDDATRAGLLRWLGYCLTAKTNEHKFAVWTGERGANGKSTLSGVMLKLLKSYGTGLASRALLKSNRPADANAATTAINALEGVRFALAEEMPIDAEIDSSLVKTLSGGDEINLRLNYGEYRTIPNLAKINISGNYLPRIENVNDGGIRRRLLNFAFNVRFGIDRPADPTLKEKLILPENLQALLALLVREAVAWYRGDGLIISDAMKAETQRQLDASNFVADFISDYYVKAPNAYVKAKDFIDELKREYPRECSRFKRADLVKLIAAQDGVTYGKDNHNANVFKGIGKLARDSDFDSEPVGKDVATP